MAKKKVSLEVFEESVLPALQQKHADVAALQKAINDGYDIFEEQDDKTVTVNFTVSAQGKAAKAPGEGKGDEGNAPNSPVTLDEKAIAKLVSETVAETMKKFGEQNGGGTQKRAGAGDIVIHDNPLIGNVKLYKPIKSFTGTNEEKKRKAFNFGAWFLGGVLGNKKYADWCNENGLTIQKSPNEDKPSIVIGKAQGEGTNTAGGVLVPDQIENDIIDLREMYGKFRANARLRPMVRDTLVVPRRASGVTAYFSSENSAITESQKSWDTVDLTAKKLAALARYSTEILEDAIISVADDLADEIVYAFSLKEDQCGFIGDSTSAYGGIEGVVTALTRVWSSTSVSSAGVIIASGNAMSEVTDTDLMQVMGTLPEYADDGSAAWFCSRLAAFAIFGRLLRASGGVTKEEAAGALPLAYGGYPIVTTQTMPRTDTNSQVQAFFGSLKKSSDFGDRRQTTISISDQRYFDSDQVGIRGTERFDINNHDVGDGTNAGPVVGLRAAAA